LPVQHEIILYVEPRLVRVRIIHVGATPEAIF